MGLLALRALVRATRWSGRQAEVDARASGDPQRIDEPAVRVRAWIEAVPREQRVRARLLENISDPRLIERIARESGARIGGTLYSHALSGPQGPAGTYQMLFEHNARTLAERLGA